MIAFQKMEVEWVMPKVWAFIHQKTNPGTGLGIFQPGDQFPDDGEENNAVTQKNQRIHIDMSIVYN